MIAKRFISKVINHIVFLIRKRHYVFTPVFIIGCGRSGTTVLGQTLAQHTNICYLNERRDLWHNAYPEFNIWSSSKKGAILEATAEHHQTKKSRQLRQLFFKEQVLHKSTILLEKLPINSFRIEFLRACFPEARFIYLHRNGMEVSHSIEKAIALGNWYGQNNQKQLLLNELAQKNGMDTDNIILQPLHQALMEWRLSIEYSHQAFKAMDKALFINLSYQDLTSDSPKWLKNIFQFLSLDCEDTLIQKYSSTIRKSKPQKIVVDEDHKTIGGHFLTQSMTNTYLKYV